MRAWQESPYRAVGVYYGGRARHCPSQPLLTRAWVRTVSRMGWAILPVYVGSQSPCVASRAKKEYAIDTSRPWEEGTAEGQDAARRAAELGFATRSPLYLDMEAYDTHTPSCAEPTLAYVRAWNREVRRHGYLPGFYSSSDSGIEHIERARRCGYDDLPAAVWFARWHTQPDLTGDPALSPDGWQPNRRIHQFAGDVYEEYGGRRLTIDRDRVEAPVAVIR